MAGDLAEKLPPAKNKFPISSVENYYKKKLNLGSKKFNISTVNEEYVFDLLKQINPTKAAGIDNLSGRFLKDGSPILAKHLTQLCNLSIKLKQFPDPCKIAKLKPLFKSGKRTEAKNYRPISLLPLISKIFEKVIMDQTQKFLTENKILY